MFKLVGGESVNDTLSLGEMEKNKIAGLFPGLGAQK